MTRKITLSAIFGGAVGDSLQVVGYPQKIGCTLDSLRVADHEHDELVVDLLVQRVDVVVSFANGRGHHNVPVYEGLKAPP